MNTRTTPGFSLALLALISLSARLTCLAAEEHVYSARMTSAATTTAWSPPCWWISAGGDAYGTSTYKSTAPGTPVSRVGCYYRDAFAMAAFPGSGFGVVCSDCSVGAGYVYQVDVTQPAGMGVSTNIIFGVVSTNCLIGGLSGGNGYPTNTTAFQAAYSTNKWGFVCYLTNISALPNPHVEFHCVSGGATDTLKHYADCVRFTLISPATGPTAVQILGISGEALAYSGGSGTRFVLLKSSGPNSFLSGWERFATNSTTPGSFTITAPANAGTAFYSIASE